MRLFLLLCLCLGIEGEVKEKSLFSGEMVVKADGIYTYAHYYQHPETEREVVIIGVNHGGDKEYFEQIVDILNKKEIVFYEGLPPNEEKKDDEKNKKKAEDELNKLFGCNMDEAFRVALSCYYRSVPKYLQLVLEDSCFNYHKDGWQSGDAEFFQRIKNDDKLQEFLVKFVNKLSQLKSERKLAIVEYVRKAIELVNNCQITKKDFGDSFVFFWSDSELVEVILEILGQPRDELVFQSFDSVIKEKNPKSIGIKFGAGHIPNQRKLLEARGYIHQKTVELCNLKF